MAIKQLLFLTMSLSVVFGYNQESINNQTQEKESSMSSYVYQQQAQKYFIGLELRTNNQECSSAMPAHKDRFFQENIPAKIEATYYFEFQFCRGAHIINMDKLRTGRQQLTDFVFHRLAGPA